VTLSASTTNHSNQGERYDRRKTKASNEIRTKEIKKREKEEMEMSNKKIKVAVDTTENVSKEDILRGLDLLEESKRSDRFFGMRIGKSIDDIENTFLAIFAEFIVLMSLFIGMLGFGILMWAIFGG
jgi:hypothetical protein